MATGRFIHRSLLGTSLAAVAILAWAGSPAGAATDVSPPTWTKVPAASIPLGAALDEIGDCGSVEHGCTRSTWTTRPSTPSPASTTTWST